MVFVKVVFSVVLLNLVICIIVVVMCFVLIVLWFVIIGMSVFGMICYDML